MNRIRQVALCSAALTVSAFVAAAQAAHAAETTGSETSTAAADAPPAPNDDDILVTATRTEKFAGTKTETPLIEIPQPITVITAEQYLSQGAISISDTVKYAAGVTASAYGRDTRVDSFVVRGIDAVQFRDGMRDIFSNYASITSDPYNFSRVEIVRGPASVLFGQGSIGGLVNLVSKTPDFLTHGEISATYGSYNRKEVMGDVNLALTDTFAVRLVGRARDADTYIDNVPDDRVFVAPSVRWQVTPDTDVTLLGLYQEDDTGSTSQFLPVVGTLVANPNNSEKLNRYTFVGKPGWDRYSGRTLQGGGSITHSFSENVTLSLKARYIDSNLKYFTHYANSYSNPTNPYLDSSGHEIGLYSYASIARMNVFSTDNNLQVKFDTGANIEHRLLAGVDYSWNKVSTRSGYGYEVVDLYNIDYDALTIPAIGDTWSTQTQKQLGIYLQDQIRLYDRVSVVLGVRRDRLDTTDAGIDKATTFRAGIIGEAVAGISPFFSYTESFEPITGTDENGKYLKPQTGRQFEAGLKWQPDLKTLVTVTAFHIKEANRPIYGVGGSVTQSGELTTQGIELEASRTLPGNFQVMANYGYNKLVAHDSDTFDYLPRNTASLWTTKTFGAQEWAQLRLGVGVVYTGKRRSVGSDWTIVTPAYTTVDALMEITRDNWRFSINATNLFNKQYYASCLARGDCFMGAPRNVMGTVGFKF
ncbi:TonB-dependent siderophore receptor [Novosphingobium sp. Rr 2-17]|uniref:TonB-dependent siderophore receptor n=1 Tax=Novosphingobium sp. Rr 2-17 TaxID=555793 RepID=UPI0002698842|nr:TonB-dependent siderophore receptor [Novosphingobium sp. Rr 2-17]EIZ80556.1 TonB-dependent siderophore receptor [Novosphingobium sp. Rr 2-17]